MPAMFEIDVELVAVDVEDFAVAELIVEDAIAAAEDRAVIAHHFTVMHLLFRRWFKPAGVPMAGTAGLVQAAIGAGLDQIIGQLIDKT